MIEQVESGPRHCMSAEYEITDGHCVSPLGNPTEGKNLEEDQRVYGDVLDDFWKGTIWQRIAQDRQILYFTV